MDTCFSRSISESSFYLTLLLLWHKFHPQKVYRAMLGCCDKTRCSKSLSFLDNCITTFSLPEINFNVFLPTKTQIKVVQIASGTTASKTLFKSTFLRFHFQVLPHGGTSFEFCHMFINNLLRLVWKYCLKWFIQMIDDWSNLKAFTCLSCFVWSVKWRFCNFLVSWSRKDILNVNVTYEMIAITIDWHD